MADGDLADVDQIDVGRAGKRRPAIVVLLVVAPVVAISAWLTLSVFGAVLGIPGLILTVPVAGAAVRAVRRPGDPARIASLAALSLAFAMVVSTGFVLLAVLVWNDVDSTEDWLLVAIGAVWWVGAWWGAVGAQRAGRAAGPRPGGPEPLA